MFTLSFCSGGNIQALLSKEQLITPTSMERCLMNLIFHSSSVRLFPINVLLNPHAITLALVQLKTCLCEKPLWDMTGVGTESLNWLGSWQSFNTSTGALADAFVKKKLCGKAACVCVCVCAQKRGEQSVRQHAFPVLQWDCSRRSAASHARTFCCMHTHSFIIMSTNMVIKARMFQEEKKKRRKKSVKQNRKKT